MCSRQVPFKSTYVSKKWLPAASGNREYETENVFPNVTSTTHLISSESSQKTVILVGPPRKSSYHERIQRLPAQVKNSDSTADITTCFATITKRLKNYNKHLKCLPGNVVGIGTRYGSSGPRNRIPVEGENLRTPPHRSWGPSSLLHNGYRLVPGSKAAGTWH